MQGLGGEANAPDGVQLTLPSGFPGYGGDGPEVRPFLSPGKALGPQGSASESGGGNGNGGGYTLQRIAEAMATYAQRCPECNGGVVNQEGCLTCHSCGWNKCE